jgi:hypothetical protein
MLFCSWPVVDDGLSLFLDTGALTATLALEVQFSPANTADLIHFDRLDIWGEQGEGPFHAYAIGDLTHGESGCLPRTLALDHITFETLDTLLVSFDDLIVDGDIITGFELRKLSFSRQLLVYKSYSSVHNFNFLRMAKVIIIR